MNISTNVLIGECNKLLKLADEVVPRLDIFEAAKQLKAHVQVLEERFNATDYNQKEVDEAKESCNSAALVLEYFLMNYDSALKTRYLRRVEIYKLYNKTKQLTFNELTTNPNDKYSIVQKAMLMHQLKDLFDRVKLLVYELSEQDIASMDKVRGQLS